MWCYPMGRSHSLICKSCSETNCADVEHGVLGWEGAMTKYITFTVEVRVQVWSMVLSNGAGPYG
jgi:hypothetical protein